jgi:hypothetical protein
MSAFNPPNAIEVYRYHLTSARGLSLLTEAYRIFAGARTGDYDTDKATRRNRHPQRGAAIGQVQHRRRDPETLG